MIVKAVLVCPFLIHHGVELSGHPPNRHPLLGFVQDLVEVIGSIEKLLHLFKSNSALPSQPFALGFVKVEAHGAVV
jgi:hypothetical protein